MAEQKFGRLTVIAEMGMRQHGFSGRARRMVKCRCDCGNEIVARKDHVENGHTVSCGCFNREQVALAATGVNRSSVEVGKVYGKTEVLQRVANSPNGAAVYLCKCQCGSTRKILGTRLLSGKAQRCRKCGYAEHLAKVHQMHTKPPGEAAAYAAFVTTKRQCADKRGLIWEIAFEDWKRLAALPCHYCGGPPLNCGYNGSYQYSGLDRVDNDVGYVLNNVVPCCKLCNCAKSDQTVSEFLDWVRRIYDHITETS